MRESTGRAIRIELLKRRIEVLANVQDDVIEPKLIAEFALGQNVSERKVKEYLNLLLKSGWCKRTLHGILPKEHADLQNAIDKPGSSPEQEADDILNNHSPQENSSFLHKANSVNLLTAEDTQNHKNQKGVK